MKIRFLNKLFNRNVVLCSSLLLGTAVAANAQMVSGNVFLQGKYVELGIAPIGAFGSNADVPDTYHPPRSGLGNWLGFISDPDRDGWDVGTPDYVGDYFLPGDPQEGWDIQIGDTWNRAWRGAMWGGGGGDGNTFTGSPLWLTGANTAYYVDGANKVGVWEGTMGETDNLSIRQVTTLDTNKVYFIVNVTLKNTGTTPLDNVYYNRTVDPDQGSSTPLGGGSSTTNTIEYQPDAAATTEDGMKCLVSAYPPPLGPDAAYLGLGTVDCRAKCYIVGTGLNPTPGSGVDLGTIYDETVTSVPPYTFDKDASVTNDIGIGLVFNIGTILPGDSTTLAYAYVLRKADLDSAFNSLTPSWILDGEQFSSGDTLRRCWDTDIDVELKGGGAYNWGEWVDLNGGPTLPPGRNHTIHVEHNILTYRVIGTSPICPLSDTMIMTFIPEGDSVVLNESICQGETFNFMGNLKYETGTYVNARKTFIGCDSIVVLNLTVNPLPDVTISARETQICEGEEALFTLDNPSAGTSYQWKRDGVNIPGATQHTYAAPAIAGVYSVSGVSSKGCTDDSRTITITVNPKAEGSIVSISEQDVCIGDTVTLISDSKPGYQYTWGPDNFFRYTSGNMNPSASAVIPGTTEVYLVSMNEYGCKDYDTAVVTAHPCCDIYIPTAFSPNNDGLNDEFAPKIRPGQTIVALQVFNRKGQLVYDNNSPQKGWNGKYNNTGGEAAQDVYMYRFVYTCTNGEVFEAKGDITLVR